MSEERNCRFETIDSAAKGTARRPADGRKQVFGSQILSAAHSKIGPAEIERNELQRNATWRVVAAGGGGGGQAC